MKAVALPDNTSRSNQGKFARDHNGKSALNAAVRRSPAGDPS
jgi:hypothetical protein